MIKAKNPQTQVLPIWQPVGYSTYQITSAIGQKFDMKATHTGVLDPLAEGVIIVLLGDERFNKSKFSDFKKGYEFDVTFGIKTDSYDGMGLVTEYKEPVEKISIENIDKLTKSFEGNYTQTVPLYSARKVNSKKLFLYPKEKLVIPELPKKSGHIYKLECKNVRTASLYSLADVIITQVKKVKRGEYRQVETIKSWNEVKTKHADQKLYTASFYVELSRGLYVRSLSQDIAERLGTIGFVSKLVRTQNGNFNRESSFTLEKIFGDNFDHEMLLSKFTM